MPGAPTSSTPGTLSVVVPAHRDTSSLRRALAALCALDPPADEVVVAVDGPDDAVATLALEHGARVVQLGAARGPAVARNAGALAARGDLLFFVDSDVVVPPGVAGSARDYLAEHPGVSAIIGTYDDAPDQPNFFSQYKNLLNHHVHQNAHREGSTFWGACGVIRRSTFEALSGFDPRYPRPTIEDIELGYRVKDRGERIHVVKHLQVKHLKRWTGRTLLSSDVRDRALPWSALILRTRRLPDDLNVDTRGRLSVALAGCAVAALAVAPRSPRALPAVPAALAGMVALDWPLLRFLAGQRSPAFAARSMGWHALYHLYSGAAFAVALGHELAGTPVWRYRQVQQRRARARRRASGLPRSTSVLPLGAAVPRHLVAHTRHVGARASVPVPVVEMDPVVETLRVPSVPTQASASPDREDAAQVSRRGSRRSA